VPFPRVPRKPINETKFENPEKGGTMCENSTFFEFLSVHSLAYQELVLLYFKKQRIGDQRTSLTTDGSLEPTQQCGLNFS
jgi:hypothetical protein